MDLAPLPIPRPELIVHVHQSGAQSWAAAAPYVVALIALVGTTAVIWQKHKTDTREHWWQRFSWALDRVLDPRDETQQTLGLTLLDVLADDKVIPKKDKQIVARVLLPYLQTNSGQTEQTEDNSEDEPGDPRD